MSGSKIKSEVPSRLIATCSVNEHTDAVVPFTLSVTSTTSGGFSAPGESQFSVVNNALQSMSTQPANGASDEFMMIGADYLSGPQCQTVNSASNVEANSSVFGTGNDDLSPGAKSRLRGVLVLKNWASPAMPDGDSSYLSQFWINVSFIGASSNEDRWENVSVTGPAVLNLLGFQPSPHYDANEENPESNWAFPLDGTSKADCAQLSPIVDGPNAETLCEQQS